LKQRGNAARASDPVEPLTSAVTAYSIQQVIDP
jgi:hypothetical protein